MSWFVYIVECADGSLYTGITNDLERRIEQHNNPQKGQGARYTRSRHPVELRYSEPYPDRAAASRREHEIKQFDRGTKLQLIGQASMRIPRPQHQRYRKSN